MSRSILFTIILVCALLLGTGAVWYVRTRPKPITAYVPPVGSAPFPQPVGSDVPTTTPIQQSEIPDAPADMRSWGERFRDTTIPEVPGVTWQTYTNKEYGFQMEYPMGWAINRNKEAKNPNAINSFPFYLKSRSPYPPILAFDVFRATLREFVSQISDLDQRFKNQGITPDATINGISLFIRGGNEGSNRDALSAVLEKDGHVYVFGESFEWHNEEVNKIIEHMVKTFHFLK